MKTEPQSLISPADIAELDKIYGATATSSTLSPEDIAQLDEIYGGATMSSNGVPQATPQSEKGFFAGIVDPLSKFGGSVLKTLLPSSLENLPTGPQLGQGQVSGLTGNVIDVAGFKQGQELTGTEYAKDVVGTTAQALSYLPIGGAVSTLGKAVAKRTMPALAKTALEGGLGTGLAFGGQALQEQKSLAESGIEAAKGFGIGAVASPVIGAGVGTLAVGAKKLAPELVNSLIGSNRAFNKAIRLGHDPGESVVKYGITANTLEDLAPKITTTREQVGQLIGQAYDMPHNATKVADYTDILDPLKSALSEAEKNPSSSKPLINRINNVIRDISQTDLTNLTPRQAFDLKQQIKSLMKFTGAPSDDLGVNGALNGVYGKLVGKINKLVPEMAELNKDYGGLLSAELSTQTKAERLVGKPFVDTTRGGVIGTGIGLATGGIGVGALIAGAVGAGLIKILNSTAFKTRAAKFLAGATKADIQATLRGKTIAEQKIIIDNYNKIMKEAGIKRVLQLPAPKEGAIQSQNFVPIKISPTNQKDISSGFK